MYFSAPPPWVISHTVSNFVNIQIARSSTVTNRTARSCGRVMCQKRRSAEAPSTLAAS
jgi:hypothetical protein